MHLLLLSLALAAPEPVALTSGWLTVVDVEDAVWVRSDDENIASAALLNARELLLIGALPGTTTVRVVSSTGLERELLLLVGRAATLQDGTLAVRLPAERNVTFDAPGIRRVVVANAELCDAVIAGPNQLEVRPRNAGSTMIAVWERDRRRYLHVTVESAGIVRSSEELDSILTEPLDRGRVAMIAGERFVLHRGQTLRFVVKDDTVITARSEGDELVLTARSRGATRFVTWDETGRASSRFVVVHERSAPPKPVWDPAEQVGVKGQLKD